MAFWDFGKKKAQEKARPDFSVLSKYARMAPEGAMKELRTSEAGITHHESGLRLRRFGHNSISGEEKKSNFKTMLRILSDPLILVMLLMAAITFVTGQLITFVIILGMVLLSVGLNFVQETKADRAVEKLKAMVQTTVGVIRDGAPKEIPIRHLVPGDIVTLSAGDIIAADVRIIRSKDLFVNQSSLTGESLPVEKHAPIEKERALLEYESVCFAGTSVESGTALAVVILTGRNTYFASIAEGLVRKVETGFDKGIRGFTFLMLRLILIMAPLVLFINGFKTGDWFQAFLFALSVVVGLTPELLPMMITVNLSNGAMRMSEKKVIVKRLNSIQNLGAMDTLCTDKTGTLTMGKVVLEKHIGPDGKDSGTVLEYAFLNSYHQTGLRNIMDEAILRHEDVRDALELEKNYRKVDEVAFDFVRRRMSVVVEKSGKHTLICKGAVEEMLLACKQMEINGKKSALAGKSMERMRAMVEGMNKEGFRVLAVAYKDIPQPKKSYSKEDEGDLVLLGFAAFLDPPKESAQRAIAELEKNGISVKVLTGDNEFVTAKICADVGLKVSRVVLGGEIENMSDGQLCSLVEEANIFAKLAPAHKERIVSALRRNNRVVGFLGDGINDAPALKAADVGISVEGASDIAKESSSMVLMERSLLVLRDGVIEGRRVFGNIDKYIKMAASSNFGNMFSVLGASIFLPFLPMLPLQVLVNNLLYDFSQATIPTDNVDKEWVEKPRVWSLEGLKKYILLMGPISSLFDFTTFFVLIFLFNGLANPDLFRTGWFVESLITQTMIIHIIRTNKVPFLESVASSPLLFSSIAISLVGILLPYSPLGPFFSLVPLPPMFMVILLGTLLAYFALTHVLKGWIMRAVEAEQKKPSPSGQ